MIDKEKYEAAVAKMHEVFDGFTWNVFEKHEAYEAVRKEMRDNFNAQDVYDYEYYRHTKQGETHAKAEHIANAIVLNIFGDNTNIKRK